MKRFLLLAIFTLFVGIIHSQTYFRVSKVLDNNYNYFSQGSEMYKKWEGKILMFYFSPYSPDAYVKIGTLPPLGPYPYAGPDGNGYNVYAFTDVYGNVMFTNFMGQLSYVAVANDFSSLSFPVSFDNVVLECDQTTKAAYDRMVNKELEQRARIQVAIDQANGGGYGGGVSNEPVKSGMSAEWYQGQYNKWASNAESIYNSLTITGVRTTNKDGEKKGYTDWGGSSEASMKVQFSSAQREMRNIRNEAARNGYSISISNWETATVK